MLAPLHQAALSSEDIVQLRTRLTVVKGYAQLLQAQLRRDRVPRQRLADYADGLTDEITELISLLQQLNLF